MTPMLLLEGVVAILLVVTITYCFVLSRRLGELRRGREAFEKLVVELNEATTRAELTIVGLRAETASGCAALTEARDRASDICNDISYLIKRGSKIVDRHDAQGTNPSSSLWKIPAKENSRSGKTQNRERPETHKSRDSHTGSGAKQSIAQEKNRDIYPRAEFPKANVINAATTRDIENRRQPTESANKNDAAQAPEKRSWVEKALIQALRAN